MHYIYAGYSAKLNRFSYERFSEIFLVKFGYSKFLQNEIDEQDWLGRMNDGFRTISRGDTKIYGPYETAPLAGFRDWELVTKVCVGNWTNASKGLEKQIDEWAVKAGFAEPRIAKETWANMETVFFATHQRQQIGTNGHGQIYLIPDRIILNLEQHMRENGVNDPLADGIIEKLKHFLTEQLSVLAGKVRSR